jgi:2-dehydropantoate 2-reductase
MTTISVIGSGAVGSYYGAMLARAGHDVRFLMRRDYDAVRASGLDIRSPRGNFHLPSVDCRRTPAEIGPVDWVICSLKTTMLGDARELVSPVLTPQTRVLALMNGLGVEDAFAEWVAPQRVFGGMAFVCINRGEPGVVHHLEYGRVSIGHLGDDAAETDGLRALLESAGIEVAVAPNLRFARWEKLCWNVPFNGLSVAAGGIGTASIMGDPELRRTAERVMREVVRVANADLENAGSSARLAPEDIVDRLFAQTGTMGDYRTSMAIDYVNANRLEVERIHGEVARRARSLGVDAASIETLYALVRAADLRVAGELRPFTIEDTAAPPALTTVPRDWNA